MRRFIVKIKVYWIIDVDKYAVKKYTYVMSKGFFERVYEVVRRIPAGKVATYGQIARMCGNARMSRQVGWALHVNPEPYEIPCHRVVTRDGRLSPAFAFGGVNVQRQLLEAENITFVNDDHVDITKHLWQQ